MVFYKRLKNNGGDIVDAFDGSARRFREERKCGRWGGESVGTTESSNLNQKRLNLEHKAGVVGVANCSKVTNIHPNKAAIQICDTRDKLYA